ncbi:MAG: hypothetical protein EOP50_03840 [Sphingobacteriales bacterium]|nr:MAG: hypothetical protein EOP50_03840 [Sphingobacteriales bacterium]
MMSVDPAAIAQLSKDTQTLIDLFNSRHVVDYWWANALLGLALLASVGVILAGLYFENAKAAALLGLVSGMLITADTIWAPGEKAQFWRELGAEAVNLNLDLRTIGSDKERYEKASAAYKVLNSNSAMKIPRGGGMAAVRQMTIDLQAKTP